MDKQPLKAEAACLAPTSIRRSVNKADLSLIGRVARLPGLAAVAGLENPYKKELIMFE